MGGTEPRERLAQVRAAALETLARAGDQQLQVVARVGVERGEELVRVDVGQRVRDLDAVALLERAALARVDLDEHVLRAGLGAQQGARALAEQALVLAVELELHDGPAVLELDLADVADPHAGHDDGLALPRGDRLGVGRAPPPP